MSEPPTNLHRAKAHDVLEAARSWLDKDGRVALATVVGTWGSAPVGVGGQMVVATDGSFEGSVSGGCVEGEVIAEAEEIMADGKPKTLDVRRRRRDRLAGGPALRRPDQGVPRAAGEGRRPAARRPAPSMPAPTAAGSSCAPASRTAIARCSSRDDKGADDGIRQRFDSGESELIETPDGEVFLHALVPPARVLIIGATHIGQILAQLVKIAGYEVVVIDPRTAFAAEARFPGIRLDTEWPQDTIPKIGLDPYTAVVALAHVGHIDDEALKLAMRSDCFYVGALGSRRNHAKRTERLKAAGFSDEEIKRIHSPDRHQHRRPEPAGDRHLDHGRAGARPARAQGVQSRQTRRAPDRALRPARAVPETVALGEPTPCSKPTSTVDCARRSAGTAGATVARAAGRSAGRRRQGGGGALGLRAGDHRRRFRRLRHPGRRGQPQRRPPRAAAGGPAGRDARRRAQPAVRLGPQRARRRGARHHLRRGRRVHRRRRREHDARAVRGRQGRAAVRQGLQGVRFLARRALPQPARSRASSAPTPCRRPPTTSPATTSSRARSATSSRSARSRSTPRPARTASSRARSSPCRSRRPRASPTSWWPRTSIRAPRPPWTTCRSSSRCSPTA